MGVISEILGESSMNNFKLAENSFEENFKLESGEGDGKQYSLQESIKPIKPLVDFADLEMCFKSDALTFNAINKSVQMIMAGGFKQFIHTRKYVITAYTKFFEEIGYVGTDTTFEELLESIFRDQMIYGNAYVEVIYNNSDTKIVDLSMIDPKKIDYAKTSDGKIILDKNGKSIGYVLKLDQGTYAEGDVVPKQYERMVSKDANGIFLLAKRVCHFKLYTLGDKFYGVGLIEPAYKSGIYKKNIEKGQANSIYARGFSPVIAYVGNERRMATPNDIKGVLNTIKKLNYQQYGALPDWVKLESLKLNETPMTQNALKDLKTDQIAALSAPQALVSGSGEATNRSTLGDQRILWEFTLKDIIKKTLSYFKKYILKPINDLNGYGGVPNVEWGELRAEDVDITADKIIRLLTSKSANITQEFAMDLEEELRKIMNIKFSGKKPKPTLKSKEDNDDKDNDVLPDIQPRASKDKGKPPTD